jgi:hypothetical protein
MQFTIERLTEVPCLNRWHTSNLPDPDQTRKTFLNRLATRAGSDEQSMGIQSHNAKTWRSTETK